jgi:hypothetical protein
LLASTKGNKAEYDRLDALLDIQLDALYKDNSKRAIYDLIAVPVLTPEQRRNLRGEASELLGLSPLNTEYKEKGLRAKLPQPVAGLPVCMSLDAYTQPDTFRFIELEKQKANELGIAINAVAKSLYSNEFMVTLKHIVDTGDMKTNINPTAAADDLIKRAKSQCAIKGNNQSQSRGNNQSEYRGFNEAIIGHNSTVTQINLSSLGKPHRNRNRTRRHSRSRSRSRSPGQSSRHKSSRNLSGSPRRLSGSPRRLSGSQPRRSTRHFSRSSSQNHRPRRSLSSSGGYTRRLKK